MHCNLIKLFLNHNNMCTKENKRIIHSFILSPEKLKFTKTTIYGSKQGFALLLAIISLTDFHCVVNIPVLVSLF